MNRVIRIEVRFDDGRGQERRAPSPEVQHAVKTAKLAAKDTASAVIRSFPGMRVTETSSRSSSRERTTTTTVMQEGAGADDCRTGGAGARNQVKFRLLTRETHGSHYARASTFSR
jgi:hypothetical protein